MNDLSPIAAPLVRVKLRETALMPSYANAFAAGMDICADLSSLSDKKAYVPAGARMLIPTGVSLEIPEGFEVQVRPRSGLALKHGLTIVNSPGTIDCDYRGEVAVIILNTGEDGYIVHHGDRIAQLVVAPVMRATLEQVDALSDTARGVKGFGSTGVN